MHLFCQDLGIKRHSFCQLFGFHKWPSKPEKTLKNIPKSAEILDIYGVSQFLSWHLFCQHISKTKTSPLGLVFCFSRHHPSDRLCAHGAQNPVRKIRGAGGTSKFRVCCSVPLRARNGIVCPHSAILFRNLRPGLISCVGFIMRDFFAKIVI